MGVQPKLWKNVVCSKKAKECQDGKREKKRRRFVSAREKGVGEVLDGIWDARNLAWLDIDEDVSGCGLLETISQKGTFLITLCLITLWKS